MLTERSQRLESAPSEIATGSGAVVRLLSVPFSCPVFRLRQASIVNKNSNTTSVTGDGSTINNNNWTISIVQAVANEVRDPHKRAEIVLIDCTGKGTR